MTTVLVVDDNVKDLNDVSNVIYNNGEYKVLTATDGEEAWKLAKKHDVDLLITDIYMKNDGVDLLGKFRRKAPKTPAIVVSDSVPRGEFDMLSVMGDFGGDVMMRKPFTVEKLMSGVENLLTAGRPNRPQYV